MKFADSRALDAIMKGIGKDMMPQLKDIGRMAVQEIVSEANRFHVPAEHLPYIFWSMAVHQDFLSSLGRLQKVFALMIDIMARTGVMPNYQRAFKIPDDEAGIATDVTIEPLAKHMGMWAARAMAPALIKVYYDILVKWAPKVPSATEGDVSVKDGFAYLDGVFREVLTLSSSWFEDGELLRRVVRFIPNV